MVEATGATFALGDGTLRDADMILNTGVTPLTAESFGELQHCHPIIRYGVGYDTIDVATATRRGVTVANAQSYGFTEVADHTCALILALVRRIPWLDGEVRAGCWTEAHAEALRVRRLGALTLGIIGLGRIGRAVARRMAAFDLRILGTDTQLADETICALGVTPLPLDDLPRESDIITLHVPLSEATHGLIGRHELALLRPTALLINTARSDLLDEAALVEALMSGRLAGSGLDVLTQEPPDPTNPLLGFGQQQVILTPHFESVSADAQADLHREVTAVLSAFLASRRPESVVNPEVFSRVQE